MPIIKKIAFLAIITAALAGLQSCHSSKKAVQPDEYPVETPQPAKISLSSELKTLADTYYDWTDVQVPVKLQIMQPKRTSLSGVAKMKNGEYIHVSIRVFGFEVGSLYADATTVQVYVKAMDMYWSEPLAALTERYGLTLTDVQSLLLGRPFLPGSGTMQSGDAGKFNVNAVPDASTSDVLAFTFTPKKLPSGLSWTYTAVAEGEEAPHLSSMTINAGDAATLDCVFGPVDISPAGAVSSSLEAGTQLRGKEFMASWKWSFESAKWNSGISVSKPKVSSSARKVETAQLLKMLNSL